jgi:opacity protein-like surface antigen
MIVRLLRALTVGVILVFTLGAQAQGPNLPKRWYVGAGAGAAFYNDWELTNTVDADLDTGYIGNITVGAYLDDIRVFRLEAEGLYTSSDINGVAGASANGTVSNTAAMFNALYDVRTGTNWTPYFGVGIGYSLVDLDSFTTPAGAATIVDDNDGVFAWQIKAGVAYQFSPSWSVNVQYRFFNAENPSFITTGGLNADAESIRSNNAEIGFRFHF